MFHARYTALLSATTLPPPPRHAHLPVVSAERRRLAVHVIVEQPRTPCRSVAAVYAINRYVIMRRRRMSAAPSAYVIYTNASCRHGRAAVVHGRYENAMSLTHQLCLTNLT